MKNHLARVFSFIAAVFLAANFPLSAQTNDSGLTPQNILGIMQRVGDWQLANPATNRPTGWIQAVGDIGMMALAGISGDAKYRDAMLAKGETNGWQLPQYGGRKYHADDQCIGQVWTELYFLYRENRMIAPMREHFDWILSHPPATQNLAIKLGQDQWTWCDALFMAPPAWLRLYAATDDTRCLDFAVTNFWRTTDFLYDTNEHLFFRDSSFFNKTEANGKKIFWSRGNGWVFAATVRMLQFLPMNDPGRPRFEQLFKDMAAKILSLQQADGMWRASLLDPDDFPTPEASGSALFTYGLAWGVNQGLLDRATFEPAVRKAWLALVGCVNDDGRLTHVQPAGSAPVKFSADATSPYGGGVFLLAGSEVYKMAVLRNQIMAWGGPLSDRYPFISKLKVKIANAAAFARNNETVEINLKQTIFDQHESNPEMQKALQSGLASAFLKTHQFAVMDGLSSRILDSQVYSSDSNSAPDKLLFQVDLAPGETKSFYILDANALAAVPSPIVKTFARYVPERYDDFAWESDRIAHRAYGLALIKAENTISSGPDVWIKTYRNLMVNEMYASGHYHMDNGDEMDDFRVGHSRGCGGLGIWDGKKLFTSSNYHNWKLITTGPIRSEFELTYDAWDAGGGRMVSETKRYSIDAGSYFTKAQSTFESDDKSPLTIGVGLAERACPTNREEFFAHDLDEGWLAYWQPEDKPKGIIGDAIILAKGSVLAFTNDAPDLPDAKVHANVPQPTHEGYPPIRNQLAITRAEIGQPLTYYFGACWDRSGDFTNHVAWENYVKRFAERRDQPLQVTIGN
jgi:rhamnogalacturonyl hydrolase YesR